MIPIGICAAVFAIVCFLGRRAMWQGIAAVLAVGYAYGIVRANVGDATHLLFDAAVAGFFAACLWTVVTAPNRPGMHALKSWTLFLIAWPTALFFFPAGDILVELVGWRANVLLLPFLLVGARLDDESLYRLAMVMAVLNIAAAAVGALEFVFGLAMFFPRTEVTEMIYLSRLSDTESIGLRIPSTFVNAHAYAGTMVMTLPYILGALLQHRKRTHVHLLMTAVVLSLLGVFMAGVRTPILVLAVLVALVTASGQLRGYARVGWAVGILLVAWVVSGEARLQRFVTLQDTEFLSERLSGSINSEFLELVDQYPFGRGLAGGGTSIPYFLQDRYQASFLLENEFARILLEQGLPGLFLWGLFMAWVMTRGFGARDDLWRLPRRLVLATTGCYFVLALTGIGLLTSIPQSVILLMGVGWISIRPAAQPRPVVHRELRRVERAAAAPLAACPRGVIKNAPGEAEPSGSSGAASPDEAIHAG